MRWQAALLWIVSLSIAGIAQGRPVSYPGGWTLIQLNDGNRSSLLAHYSVTAYDAVGLYVERNWEEDVTFTGLQYNRLVKRWNAPGSQANIYAKFGAGQADPFGSEDAQLSGFAEISIDWETRRWLTEYKLRARDYADNKSLLHTARAGVAPYIGGAGDLHTWFILELANNPDNATPVQTTPLLRFFKGTQLLEIGYTIEQNEWLANWVVRF